MATFDDVQCCVYADIVGGWVRKGPKMCWRNIRIVPKGVSGLKSCLESSYHQKVVKFEFYFGFTTTFVRMGWKKIDLPLPSRFK